MDLLLLDEDRFKFLIKLDSKEDEDMNETFSKYENIIIPVSL